MWRRSTTARPISVCSSPSRKTNASPVWPPSGIAFAAILLLGYRVWPGIAIGAFLANMVVFLTNQAASLPIVLVLSLGIAVGNTLEAVCGAALLRKLGVADEPLQRARAVFLFLIATLLMCMVSSIVRRHRLGGGRHHPVGHLRSDLVYLVVGRCRGSSHSDTGTAESVSTEWRGVGSATRFVESVLLFSALFAVGNLTFEHWFSRERHSFTSVSAHPVSSVVNLSFRPAAGHPGHPHGFGNRHMGNRQRLGPVLRQRTHSTCHCFCCRSFRLHNCTDHALASCSF